MAAPIPIFSLHPSCTTLIKLNPGKPCRFAKKEVTVSQWAKNFHNIGYRKRPSAVSFRMRHIENTENIFQRSGIHFTMIYSFICLPEPGRCWPLLWTANPGKATGRSSPPTQSGTKPLSQGITAFPAQPLRCQQLQTVNRHTACVLRKNIVFIGNDHTQHGIRFPHTHSAGYCNPHKCRRPGHRHGTVRRPGHEALMY